MDLLVRATERTDSSKMPSVKFLSENIVGEAIADIAVAPDLLPAQLGSLIPSVDLMTPITAIISSEGKVDLTIGAESVSASIMVLGSTDGIPDISFLNAEKSVNILILSESDAV